MAYSILSDIDGVLHRDNRSIPGAARFVSDLQKSGRKFLFLTNSPDRSPREHQIALRKFGMEIDEKSFYTAAQAMGEFVTRVGPRKPSVFLVGSRAVRDNLRAIGARFTDKNPDFVVLTSGGSYTREDLDKAIELVMNGAKFITANCESAGLTATGLKVGCGGLIAPVEIAAGVKAYVVGKPNHLMIRAAERKIGLDPSQTFMLGDCLTTDIDVGIQAQMKTILVMSGITTKESLLRSAYRPDYIFPHVGKISLRKLP